MTDSITADKRTFEEQTRQRREECLNNLADYLIEVLADRESPFGEQTTLVSESKRQAEN